MNTFMSLRNARATITGAGESILLHAPGGDWEADICIDEEYT